MAPALALVWTAFAIVGWRLVRGHGQGPRLLVWLIFVLGPFGLLIWWSVRRGARLGAEAAEAAEATRSHEPRAELPLGPPGDL